MLTLEQVIEKLQDRNVRHVARMTGISYSALCRVRNGQSKMVSYEIVKKLSDYFEAQNG